MPTARLRDAIGIDTYCTEFLSICLNYAISRKTNSTNPEDYFQKKERHWKGDEIFHKLTTSPKNSFTSGEVKPRETLGKEIQPSMVATMHNGEILVTKSNPVVAASRR